MPFFLLMLFALICLQTQTGWPEPLGELRPADGAVLALGQVVLAWVLAGMISLRFSWRLAAAPWQRADAVRRWRLWRRVPFVLFVVAYIACLYFLGGALGIEEAWRQSNYVVGGELALMLPLLAGILLIWERQYLVEKALFEQAHAPDAFLSRWSYLLMQARHNFILVAPPLLLWLLRDTADISRWQGNSETGAAPLLATIGVLAAALVLLPYLIRLFLGLKPMPASPLRSHLEATARRLNFRFGNILVWDTRMTLANALLSGVFPWNRYVVFSDRLLSELSREEIEAVFGHEIGHVKYHHQTVYAVFALASLLLLGIVGVILRYFTDPLLGSPLDAGAASAEIAGLLGMLATPEGPLTAMAAVSASTPEPNLYFETVYNVLALTAIAAYFFVAFGTLSRNCERQADLYGAAVVDTPTFIEALEKVAMINGMPRGKPDRWYVGWQHPTIEERIDFLREAADNPARARQFHRTLAGVKLALFLALPTSLGVIWLALGFDRLSELVQAVW